MYGRRRHVIIGLKANGPFAQNRGIDHRYVTLASQCRELRRAALFIGHRVLPDIAVLRAVLANARASLHTGIRARIAA
jgi:hypothetical protein